MLGWGEVGVNVPSCKSVLLFNRMNDVHCAPIRLVGQCHKSHCDSREIVFVHLLAILDSSLPFKTPFTEKFLVLGKYCHHYHCQLIKTCDFVLKTNIDGTMHISVQKFCFRNNCF